MFVTPLSVPLLLINTRRRQEARTFPNSPLSVSAISSDREARKCGEMGGGKNALNPSAIHSFSLSPLIWFEAK